MDMRIIVAAICFLWVAPAWASCADSYYNSTSSSRVNAAVALIQAGDIVIVGDSHYERMETTYAQRSQSINDHPVVILGSAGATWQTLRDCFPWSSIGARHPGSIHLQASINDVVTGQCCNGYTSGADATASFAQVIMQAITNARTALGGAKWPSVSTDPPAESAAGVDAYEYHAANRVVYYVATNCGGSCAWTAFNWFSTEPSSPLTFVDQFYLMRAASCDASSTAYAGNPCYAVSGATLDNVHFPNAGNVTMFGNLAGIP
jgi:hypothetical protein